MAQENILIVEDEHIIALVIKKQLVQYGFNVVDTVSSAKDAVRIALETRPDLVLMDIHLKGELDGIDAIEEIKRHLDVPVIFLTAFSDDRTIEKAKLVGPAGFLIKPIDEKELYTNVTIALYKHQLDKKLKESELRYNSLFNYSLDSLYILDLNGQFLDANNQALELLGYTRDELPCVNIADIVSEEQIPQAFSEIENLKNGKIQNGAGVFKLKHKSGKSLYLECTYFLIYKDDEPYAVHGIARNVTEKRRAEESLKRSEEKYRRFIQNSDDGIALINEDGQIIDWNYALEEITGLSAEEVLGKYLWDLHGYLKGKDDKSLVVSDAVKQSMLEMLKTGLPKGEPTKTINIITRNKETKSVESRIFPIKTAKGFMYGGIFRDITSILKSEADLNKSLQLNKALFEGSVDPIIITDLKDIVQAANKACERVFGYKHEELIGRTFPGHIGFDNGKFEEWVEKCRTGDGVAGYETVRRTKSGELIPVSISVSPILDASGQLVNLSLWYSDISARRKAEEALRTTELDYHSLIDSVDGIVWEFDIEASRVTFVSKKAEKILGYPVEAWTNEPDFWYEHLYPENRDEILASSRRNVENKTSFDRQYRMIAADGRIVWIRDIITASQDNGQRNKLRGIMIDITEYKKIEEELRKLSMAVEQSPVLIAITDTNASIEYINPKFSEVSGYSFQEALGQNPRVLKSGETPPEVYKQLWDTITSGRVWKGEFKNKKKNGELYWESATIAPLRDQDGKITHYVAVKEETTGKKIAEKALIDSEDRYRRLVEMSPDAIAIYCNWIVVYVNDAAVRLMKAKDKEALLGRNALDFVHPDFRKSVIERGSQVAQGGTAPFTEEKFITINGEKIDVEVGSVPTTYKARPAVQVIIRDIGERKKAEQALVLSEERFRTVFEKSPVGITISINRVLLQVNKAYLKMFGFENSYELIGTSFLDRIAPDQRPWLIERLEKRAKGHIAESAYDSYGIRKDGSLFPVHIEVAHLNLSEGVASMALISDITDLYKREEEVKNSLKEKEILLKEIHHRVKNNLQIISSLLSLQSEYITDEKSLSLFNDSRNRVKSMALIHERLYQSNDLARIDFSEYINELTSYLFRTYLTHTKAINISVDADKIYMSIDSAIPCGLIINELVSNSLKYAFPENSQGRVDVTFKADETDNVLLIISDDGIGFPEEIDFKNTVTLGFQLINSLVEQLNATIELERTNGTRFTIKFVLK